MKIAFTGCSGTGKTTLARHVAEIFNLAFNPVGAREVAKAMGFNSPYDTDAAGRRMEFTERLLVSKYRWEAEVADVFGGFVTDRTGVDSLVYQMLSDCTSRPRSLSDLVYMNDQRYDLIVLCGRASFWDLGDDPVRNHDLSYHDQYEHELAIGLGILSCGAHGTTFVPMTQSTLEGRKAEVEAIVRRRFGV